MLIFICFNFIIFGFQLRFMYRKNGLFLIGHVLEPNSDYIEKKRLPSILFKRIVHLTDVASVIDGTSGFSL